MSDFDSISDIIGHMFSSDSEEKSENSGDGGLFGNIDIDTILKIGEIMSKLSETDKNTELLLALKPHLSKENQDKVDKALMFLKIMTILPLLKESGLLDKLF